jgi:hypothetical protein
MEQLRALVKKFWLSVVALIAGWFAGLNLGPAPEVVVPPAAPVVASSTEVAAVAVADGLRAELAAAKGKLAAICAGHVGDDKWKAECGD